jgi:hypothetical protein
MNFIHAKSVQFCTNLNQIYIAKVVTTNNGSDQIDEKAM